MKKLIFILLFSMCSVPVYSSTIDFTFDYSYETPGCADAADLNCVQRFEIRDQQDGTVVASILASPSAIPVSGILATASGYPKIGERTFGAFAVAVDDNGNLFESKSSIPVTVSVSPSEPTGLAGQVR